MSFMRIIDDKCDQIVRVVGRHSVYIMPVILILSVCLNLFYAVSLPLTSLQELYFIQNITQDFNPAFDISAAYHNLYQFFGFFASPDNIIPYRIIPVLGNILMTMGIFLCSRRLFGREAGFIAGILSSIIFSQYVTAPQMSLCVGIILIYYYALICLWRNHYTGDAYAFHIRHKIIFWLSSLLSVMLIPVSWIALIIPIICLSLLGKNIKWLYPLGLFSFGIMSIGFTVLYALMTDLSITDFLYNPKIPLSYMSQHLMLMGGLILFAPLSLWYGIKNRHDERFLFIMTAIVPLWIVFEMMPYHNDFMILVIMSLLCILTAGMIIKYSNTDYYTPKFISWLSVGLYIFVILCTLYVVGGLYHSINLSWDMPVIILGILFLSISIFNIIMFQKTLFYGIIGGLFVQMLIMTYGVGTYILPAYHDKNMNKSILSAIASSGCSQNSVFVADYNADIFNFKYYANIHSVPLTQAVTEFQNATPCSLFFIPKYDSVFKQTYVNISPIHSVSGFDMNRLDFVHFNLYKR